MGQLHAQLPPAEPGHPLPREDLHDPLCLYRGKKPVPRASPQLTGPPTPELPDNGQYGGLLVPHNPSQPCCLPRGLLESLSLICTFSGNAQHWSVPLSLVCGFVLGVARWLQHHQTLHLCSRQHKNRSLLFPIARVSGCDSLGSIGEAGGVGISHGCSSRQGGGDRSTQPPCLPTPESSYCGCNVGASVTAPWGELCSG